MFENPKIRQMHWPKLFRTNIPFGRIIPPFFLRKLRILPCFQLFTCIEFDFSSQRNHFRDIFRAHGQVPADLCARSAFRGGPLLDIHGSHQLLTSSHVRERDEALLRSVMVGVWNGFLLGKMRGEMVPCPFCGGDGDGHLFWECPYPPLVETIS